MSAGAAEAGGMVIQADTETLPQVAASWRELVPEVGPPPEHFPTETSTDPLDPATNNLFWGTATWIFTAQYWQVNMEADADALVSWIGTASAVFNIADQSHADQISSVLTLV